MLRLLLYKNLFIYTINVIAFRIDSSLFVLYSARPFNTFSMNKIIYKFMALDNLLSTEAEHRNALCP